MVKYSINKANQMGQWADPCFHTMLGGYYVACPIWEETVIDIIFY